MTRSQLMIDHPRRTLQNNPANIYHVPEGLHGMGPSLFGGMPPFHGLPGGPREPPPPPWVWPAPGMPVTGYPGLPPWCIGSPGPGLPPMGQTRWSEHTASDGTKCYHNAETQESIVILFLGGQSQTEGVASGYHRNRRQELLLKGLRRSL
eukprot:GFUD01080589.1.p1 GENE.GFUD01080589.1~~GFUD01080589.1.p1  ORF type:complete len:150 (+),score=31.45 GFUD01080589.1:103-552(+)